MVIAGVVDGIGTASRDDDGGSWSAGGSPTRCAESSGEGSVAAEEGCSVVLSERRIGLDVDEWVSGNTSVNDVSGTETGIPSGLSTDVFAVVPSDEAFGIDTESLSSCVAPETTTLSRTSALALSRARCRLSSSHISHFQCSRCVRPYTRSRDKGQ